MSDALVTQLARSLNLPPDAARHTLNHLVATLRDQLDATGQAQVPGLGTFHRDEGGLSFHPDDALARAVNHRYAGLRPIEAGFGSARTKPEAEPAPEPDDPFAEAGPSEETAETADTELPEAAVFQPLESFVEPDEVEQNEPDDEFAPKPADPFEAARPEDESSPEALPADEPVADEPAVDEFVAEEPPEEEPFTEPEVEANEERGLDELLAGTWTEHTDTPDDEHVLGPPPPDDVEDADYALVEPDEGDVSDEEITEAAAPDVDAQAEPGTDLEGAPEETLPAAAELDEWEEATEDEELSYDEDEFSYEDDLSHAEEAEPEVTAEPSAPPMPAEPPPAAEVPPEPEAELPARPQPVAPAVAATSRAADRAPAEPSRNRSLPIALTVLGVVLGVVALLWFLNREPESPVVAEQPVPADTAVVAEAPPPASDTLAASAPADTAATVAEAPPEPDEPAAPADPLRGTAGLDPAAGGWTWVVASEASRSTAERRAARYRDQGLRVGVIAGETQGRTRYRVGLGQFATVDEANRFRSDLPADVPAGTWLLQL